MIRELRLQNWKSYSDSTLYIDPLTFVIGTNASGKSNLLDAFYFLSRLAKGRPIDEVAEKVRGGKDWIIKKDETQSVLSVVVSKDIDSPLYTYSISFERTKDSFIIVKETLRRNKPERDLFWTNPAENDSPVIDTRFYTGKRGHARRINLGRTSSILSQIESLNVQKEIKEAASVLLQNLLNVFILNPIPNNMRDYTPLASSLKEDASNVAGVLAGLDEIKKRDLESTLSKYMKNLPEEEVNKVWTELVGRFKTDAMIYCEEQWSNKEKTTIDARGMSDGTLRFLAIVVAMLTVAKGSLLIVEEVDNGLHPSRSNELVSMLQEIGEQRNVDVLCTTHNPVLIDELGVEMIPFIFYIKRTGEKGSSIIEALENKKNLAKLMAQHSIGGLMVEDKL